MAVEGRAESFFISHAGADRAWAEWIAWQLRDAGCTVWLDTLDISPGVDWNAQLNTALRNASHVLLLVSAAYHDSVWARREREAAEAAGAVMVPVLLDDTRLPDDLRDHQYVRFAHPDDRTARDVLLRAVVPSPPPVRGHLRRLGATSPRLPGSLPRVWNTPARHDRFIGRDQLLTRLRTTLTEQAQVVLVGEPGMGKTCLAVEYAHRFAGEYELVWWIRAVGRQPIVAQLAELAVRTGAAGLDTRMTDALKALASELRTRGRWLLVFDDVTDPTELPTALLEDTGNGQILLTSRDAGRLGHAEPVEVGAFTPAESAAMLRELVPSLSASDAREVASDVREMPLALVQAAGIIGTGVTVGAYRRMLSADAVPDSPPHVLEHTVRLARERLAQENPEADALVSACALLGAPQPFPLRACRRVPAWAPRALAALLHEPGAADAALDAVQRFGLARTTGGTLRFHPAVQSALRAQLSEADRADAALGAQALLVSAFPPRSAPPEAWTALLPHLLAVAPADLTHKEGRHAAREACVHLLDDDASAAVPRLRELWDTWRGMLGPDHADTMEVASLLAQALRESGDPEAARPLVEAVLEWERRTFGHDHPVPLETAAGLTGLLIELGRPQEAMDLGSQTLERLRTVLGPDHPSTLGLTATLILGLQTVGETTEARLLCENILDRQRRVLGPDHPDTLVTAARMAGLLEEVGELLSARNLREDVVLWHRRTLGPDDPATLRAVASLGTLLDRLGEHDEACAVLSDVLEREEGALGRDHPDTMRTVAVLAAVLTRLGRTAPALALTERLARWQQRTLGPENPAALRTSALLAGLYLRGEDFEVALQEAQDARARQQQVLGPAHADTLRTTVLLIACLTRTGQTSRAETLRKALLPDVPPHHWPRMDEATVVRQFLDEQISAAAAVPEQKSMVRPGTAQPFGPVPTRAPSFPGRRENVLVSYVETDRRWAEWVRHELVGLGHDVTMEAEDTYAGRPLSRESDIVLVLLSPAYAKSLAAASPTAAEWAELMDGDAPGRRLIPLFVQSVDPGKLPRALRKTPTPPLSDLDPDAARDLLRFALDAPVSPSHRPAFPGTSGSADNEQDLLTRRLVNALERSASLQNREGRRLLLELIDVPLRLSRGELSLRTTLYEVVRTLKAQAGGLNQLVDALEALELDSLAVAEARRVVREIERGQEAR